MLRALLIALAFAAGACSHARAPVAVPNSPPERAVSARARTGGPTGSDVTRMLEASGLYFHTIERDRQWMLAFTGERLPQVVLHVMHRPQFTVVLGRLFEVPEGAGVDFYRALALKNFELDQLKLSVDPSGVVFASFEVPTRILDQRELLENVLSLATIIDNVVPELLEQSSPAADEPFVPPPPRDPERDRTLEAAIALQPLPSRR